MQVLRIFRQRFLLAMAFAGIQQAVVAQSMASPPSDMTERPAQERSERNRMIDQILALPCSTLERGISGLVIAEISQSGHYCLTEDFHARLEFADHAAEARLISIVVGNVVLDLQGHTLGRGRIFKNPGGDGIEIVDPERFVSGVGKANNIVIRNGILQDFEVGVFFGDGRWRNRQDIPTFDVKTNTYHFPENRITLEEITFKNNKKNFDIRVPGTPSN